MFGDAYVIKLQHINTSFWFLQLRPYLSLYGKYEALGRPGQERMFAILSKTENTGEYIMEKWRNFWNDYNN